MSVLTKQCLRNAFFLSVCPLRRAVRHKPVQLRSALPMTQPPFAGVARDVFVLTVIGWSFRIQSSQHNACSLIEAGRRGFQHFVDVDEPGYLLEQLPGTVAPYQIKLHVKVASAIYFDVLSDKAFAMLRRSMAQVIQDFEALSSLLIVQYACWYALVELLQGTCRSNDGMNRHEGFGNVSEKLITIEKKMLVFLATNPVNFYEYITMGKSVACVDLPETDSDVAKNA